MLKSPEILNNVTNSRNAYENTGPMLEEEFIGKTNEQKYKEKAFLLLHPEESPEKLSGPAKAEKVFQIRDLAQKEFENALALADKNKYINFKNSMRLAEECQTGNPEKPDRFFSLALYNYIKSRFDEGQLLKFFTAVGTHLDIKHGVDCFFKLYSQKTGEELTFATIDLTGRSTKDTTKANVLLNINGEEKDKYDPSQGNKNFDKTFFTKKISEFGEMIIAAMLKNYKEKLEKN